MRTCAAPPLAGEGWGGLNFAFAGGFSISMLKESFLMTAHCPVLAIGELPPPRMYDHPNDR